jgi:glycosyltransferase involved in cell wall biosynthesis
MGVPEDGLLLLYAGAMGDAQGLDALIDALHLIRHTVSVTCLLAGSGTAERRLRDRAAELGLNNVRFLGQLPRQEMPRLMAAADLHVVSLRDSSLSCITMPSKIQTILASGKPFVAAVSGDAAAVARDSGAAFVALPGDSQSMAAAIQTAAAPGVDLRSMGNAGAAYYQAHFSLSSGVDRIESLLRAAADGQVGRSARRFPRGSWRRQATIQRRPGLVTTRLGGGEEQC